MTCMACMDCQCMNMATYACNMFKVWKHGMHGLPMYEHAKILKNGMHGHLCMGTYVLDLKCMDIYAWAPMY